MDIWTILAITCGSSVLVFQVLVFIGLFVKYKKMEIVSDPRPTPLRKIQTGNITFTDPHSGNSLNFERVSNASSLRSTRSIGFIEYAKSEDGSTRGRITPVMGSLNGSINSATLNHSMGSITSVPGDQNPNVGSINPIFEETSQKTKKINVNPLFEEDSPRCHEKHTTKLRAVYQR